MLIGCAQWTVTIGRYDIQYATNTLARYSACPRLGYLKRALRLFGYLKHHKKYRIEFDSDLPKYIKAPQETSVNFVEHDWWYQYAGYEDDIPEDMPPFKPQDTDKIYITCFVDASHACDLNTRRSVTGILLFLNNTPVKWYSKRQNTVETSTYGSELVAARIAIELILEYRYKL